MGWQAERTDMKQLTHGVAESNIILAIADIHG
jgi:hypothetical protein